MFAQCLFPVLFLYLFTIIPFVAKTQTHLKSEPMFFPAVKADTITTLREKIKEKTVEAAHVKRGTHVGGRRGKIDDKIIDIQR